MIQPARELHATAVPFLTIRRAGARDATGLAALRRASLAELGHFAGGVPAGFERRAAAEIAAMFERDMVIAFVALEGDAVVGSACVVFWTRMPYGTSALHGELAGVYVAPAFRGYGYARSLCAAALDSARTRHPRSIFVHPSEAGLSLYRALGFKPASVMQLGM